MVRFLRTVYRHASPRHGLPAAVLLSRLRTRLVSALQPERVAALIGEGTQIAKTTALTKSLGIAKAIGIARWVERRPAAVSSRAGKDSSGPVPDAARAGTRAKPPNSMQTFVDLIAKAVNPSMSRDERERVYSVVRQAVLRLHEGRAPLTADPQVALQLHLVEETIRDLEAEIARHNAMERMRLATEAQAAEIAGKPD